jgi:hypothetical protein
MGVEADFSATRKLSTRVGFSWQRSHGGGADTHVGHAITVGLSIPFER